MNVYLPNGRLPSAYQEVEYIQSSGTQYINTDIKLNQTHTIELKLNINSNLNQWDKFYGGGDNGSMLFAQYEKSSGTDIQNRIKITNKSSNNMYSTNPQTISAGGTHIFIHSNTSFYIDGVSQSTTTATTFTMNTGLNIFAMGNSQSTGREKSSYKLYYMKIYNSNSSLAYDFVPCYRKQDSVIGLYDLVNNQFYTNSGTGTFSKGNDVTMAELKNAYIGEVWTPGSNTVAYFPFSEDANDHSGNGVTLTNTQYLSKQSLGYSWVASQGIAYSSIELLFTNHDAKFISMWLKVNSSSGNTEVGTLYKYGLSEYSPSHYDNSSISNKFYLFTNSSYSVGATSNGLTFNEWHHITIGYDGSKVVISKDGVQETLYNGSGYDFGNQVVLCGIGSRGNANYTLSECIVETVARTAQEISDYYNKTKSNYGL